MIAVLLAAVWLPVMSHCDLEHLPGFQFLACCDHPGTAPHEDNDCEADACATVESGFYKAAHQRVWVPPPPLLVHLMPAIADPPPLDPPPADALSAVPLELSQTWQFSTRAASPPRAPSGAS